MKNVKTLGLLLFCLTLSFYSCKDKSKTTAQEITKQADVTEVAKSVTPPLKEPAQNASGVWHYTCRIGCPGGAGLAAKCKTCGTILIHNKKYHANTTSPTNSTPFANPTVANNSTKSPEPAQNAAGVWHYTCAKGDAGGAGSAIACTTCGETLVHNTAYH